jgi:hypothetical protein
MSVIWVESIAELFETGHWWSQLKQGIGGARRDRTADLNTASVALSQLSYGPKKCISPDTHMISRNFFAG